MKFVAALLLLCFVSAVVCQDGSAGRGRLVVQKKLHTEYPEVFAKGQNFTVQITVHNIGDAAAYGVKVNDAWAPEAFEVAEGATALSWEEIAAGASVSSNYSVTPTLEADYFSGPAEVTYQATLDGAAQTASSSALGWMRIINDELYARLTATHTREWTIFSIGLLFFVAAPLAVYSYIQMNYDNGIPKTLLKSE